MNITILMSEVLPLPAVRGGAVEALAQYILDENELNTQNVNFDVITIRDEKAVACSNLYRKTNFRFIKPIPFRGIAQKIYTKISLLIKGKFPPDIYCHQAIKALKKNRASVVIVENRPEFILSLRKALPHAKLVLHLHNDTLNSASQDAGDVLAACDCVLCVSGYIKSRVLTIPCAKDEVVRVLPNAVDSRLFQRKRPIPELSPRHAVIGYVGRVGESKGVGLLVDAFVRIRSSYSDLSLCIVGSSWFGNNEASPFIAALQEKSSLISNSITFTGYLPHQDVPSIQEKFTVQVIPSIWMDPAPLSVIEALSMQVPVVAAAVGGIPEYADDSVATLFSVEGDPVANLEAALRSVLDDYGKAKEKAAKARERVEARFSRAVYYRAFMKELKKIVESAT